MKTTNQILGEQLKAMRERAELTIDELAEKMGTSRSHISEIEKGKKNFTGPYYDRLMQACNTTPETAFAGPDKSGIPRDLHDLYWMLDVIVDVRNEGEEGKRMVDGIRVNLEAISEKGARIKKSRASPRPESGQEAISNRDGKTGNTKKRTTH